MVSPQQGHANDINPLPKVLGATGGSGALASRMNAVSQYFADTEQNHKMGARWLQVRDSVNHAKYKEVYNKVMNRAGMGNV